MLGYAYTFVPKADVDADVFTDALFDWILYMTNNGQMLYESTQVLHMPQGYVCRFIVPEREALDRRWESVYVQESRQVLWSLCAAEPVCAEEGEALNQEDVCTCAHPSYRVLLVEGYVGALPVYCGDCKAVVPLYRLPLAAGEEEYGRWVQAWRETYQAFDQAWCCSLAGERYTYRMLHAPSSELNAYGRELAAQLEQRTGVPVYGFLLQWGWRNRSTCPVCGKEWRNYGMHADERYRYDTICHDCRLVSNDPW